MYTVLPCDLQHQYTKTVGIDECEADHIGGTSREQKCVERAVSISHKAAIVSAIKQVRRSGNTSLRV